VTLKSESKVTQGHLNRHVSIRCIWLPICIWPYQRNTNRKPHPLYRMVPLSTTSPDLWPGFQSRDIFKVEYVLLTFHSKLGPISHRFRDRRHNTGVWWTDGQTSFDGKNRASIASREAQLMLTNPRHAISGQSQYHSIC